MAKTEKLLAELMVEEKKLLEQQKNEQDELKQKTVPSRNSSGKNSAN